MVMKELSRRDVLKAGAVGTMTHALTGLSGARISEPVRLGMIADLHGGLAPDAMRRLDSFLKGMAGTDCDALVQMGDFAYPNKKHQVFADKLNGAHTEVVHVIGNHEFDFGLTRKDCYQAWGISSSYYAKDIGGIRLLILDGNESGSAKHKGGYPSYIGPEQVKWLANALQTSEKPVLLLSHQPLAGSSAIDNADEIQKLLTEHKEKIVLCVNGHTHLDRLLEIEGVSYFHLNSASYFWVGGKARMAHYKNALFTTLTIDPKKCTVSVEPCVSEWAGPSPEKLGYFDVKRSMPKTSVTPQIRSHNVQ